jgi:hypothetical protein
MGWRRLAPANSSQRFRDGKDQQYRKPHNDPDAVLGKQLLSAAEAKVSGDSELTASDFNGFPQRN